MLNFKATKDWLFKYSYDEENVDVTTGSPELPKEPLSKEIDESFKVPYTKILEVRNHPGADRLDILKIYGFEIVATKNMYKIGDEVFFCPVDAVLNPDLEYLIFPKDSKITLHKHRVRQIRIRKFPSQGLVIDKKIIDELLTNRGLKTVLNFELEKNYAELLQIVKYEPPHHNHGQSGNPLGRNKWLKNPHFMEYNGITNIKWHPNYFDGCEVVVQEKIHGSMTRAGYVPSVANTVMKKIKKFFGLLPKYEHVWGSNRVELTNKSGNTSFYGHDVYGDTIKEEGLFDKIKEGEIIYGELIGQNIQAHYHYGYKDRYHIVIFDVKKIQEDGGQKWLTPDEVEAYVKERGFDFVPILYKGTYNKQMIEELVTGPSVYYPEHKVREGIVIKDTNYNDERNNKRSLKWINPEYLDNTSNSDNH